MADIPGFNAAIDVLSGPLRESLARRMGVSAITVLRDEARQLAPMGKAEESAQRQYGGSITPGLLKSAIYSGYDKKGSTKDLYRYLSSWNRRKAPHGHLIEFGHAQPYRIVFVNGHWVTLVNKPGTMRRTPAYPFLGPAYDAAKGRAYDAAIARAQIEFPALVKENARGD